MPVVSIALGTRRTLRSCRSCVWVLGSSSTAAGYLIYKWNGATYELASGNLRASAISVNGSTGVPWIVSGGRVYERSSTSVSSGSWTQRGPNSNCATDIASGPNGTAWEIGCTVKSGGFNVASYSPSTNSWTNEAAGVAGTRIAAENTGTPWLVNDGKEIWRKLSTTWGKVEGRGTDIAAGPTLAAGKGYVFVTGQTTGDVYVWNEQGAVPGDPDGPATNSFRFFSGQGTRIAVGSDGRPWVIANGNQTIWRTVK